MVEKSACKDVLLAADDPVHREMPPSFDREAAIAAVVRVQPDLVVGLKMPRCQATMSGARRAR